MAPAIRDILVRIEATIDTLPRIRSDPIKAGSSTCLVSDYTLRVLMPQSGGRNWTRQGARVRLNLMSQTASPFLMLEQWRRRSADLRPMPFVSRKSPRPRLISSRTEYVVIAWAERAPMRQGPDGSGAPIANRSRHAIDGAQFPQRISVPAEALMLSEKPAFDPERVDLTTFSFSALPHLVAGTGHIATVHSPSGPYGRMRTPFALAMHPRTALRGAELSANGAMAQLS